MGVHVLNFRRVGGWMGSRADLWECFFTVQTSPVTTFFLLKSSLTKLGFGLVGFYRKRGIEI